MNFLDLLIFESKKDVKLNKLQLPYGWNVYGGIYILRIETFLA